MNRTLQYHVPPLGLVRTVLRQEARALYEFLDERGEIDRLKRLDHLGVVRRASEGAHHPRWEYIMLIMHLVDLTKDHVREAHLSTGPSVAGYQLSSGQELLKTWALLLHLGHLHWTFTAEKAILAEVKRSAALRRDVLNALPDDDIRMYARRLLRTEDVYRFYHVVAFLRLNHLARGAPHRQLWTDLLRAYCLRTPEVARLADIYRQLRRIAFFVLDSHYTPALAGLDFAEILTDPTRLVFTLDPPDSSSAALLDAIETHLYETVYLSREVLRHAAALVPSLRKAIRKAIRRQRQRPVQDLIEELARGDVQEGAEADAGNLSHVVSIPFRVSEPFTSIILPEARPLREELDWCARLPKRLRSSIAVSVWPFADGRQEAVDVFTAQRSGPVIEAALAGVLDRLAHLYEDDRRRHGRLFGRDFLQDILYGRVAAAIILSGLRHIFERASRWEFRPVAEGPRPYAVFVRTRRESRTFLSAELRTLSRKHTDEAEGRKKELRAIRAALQRERCRCIVLALARLQAFDEDGKNIGEIDGVWISLSYRKIKVVIVEAKDPAKRAQGKILQQLRSILKKLGLWPECKPEVRYHPKTGQHPHFGQVVIRFTDRQQHESRKTVL